MLIDSHLHHPGPVSLELTLAGEYPVLHANPALQEGVQKMLNTLGRSNLGATRRDPGICLLAPTPGFYLGPSVAEQDQRLLVLKASGDIDLATSEHLQAQLHILVDAGYRQLIVDLADVSFCDAAGLGAFVSGRKHACAYGGSLRLAAPQPIVAKVFRITAGTHDIRVDDTVEQALASSSA